MTTSVLSASIFSEFPQIVFGFSTRRGGVSPPPFDCNMGSGVGDDPTNVEENRRRFLDSLGVTAGQLAIPKQVHGDTVIRVRHAGVYGECDALVTNAPEVFLRVMVADCLAVFVFDPPTQSVAATHCGWRGCAKNVVGRTIERMVGEFTAAPETMLVYIGPSARLCCYEVGDDVAAQFESRFLVRGKDTRPHLDMQGHTLQKLLSLGVKDSHVEMSSFCTICTPQLFHSYRRDGARAGRMMGLIGLRAY